MRNPQPGPGEQQRRRARIAGARQRVEFVGPRDAAATAGVGGEERFECVAAGGLGMLAVDGAADDVEVASPRVPTPRLRSGPMHDAVHEATAAHARRAVDAGDAKAL
jgi:hypothetical protein